MPLGPLTTLLVLEEDAHTDLALRVFARMACAVMVSHAVTVPVSGEYVSMENVYLEIVLMAPVTVVNVLTGIVQADVPTKHAQAANAHSHRVLTVDATIIITI
jgi:hypothetical protein